MSSLFPSKYLFGAAIALLLGVPSGASGQQDHAHHQPEKDTEVTVEQLRQEHARHHDHQHGNAVESGGVRDFRAANYLFSLSSGTSLNPSAWAMPMVMTRAGNWRLMWMGEATLSATQQTGPRGADKVYSTNWGMLGAVRTLGKGAIMVRGMTSLEPLTVTGRKYPLLFQTGEAAYGTPIVDGQHPHDLIMEMGVHYARPLGSRSMFSLYYAPVGDPALGPVAFPHRASAAELPQATLGHHWQDATHISNNVVTAGIAYRGIRLEASGFRGREPNENRWNIDMGGMDSWAGRVTLQPSRNWLGQVSLARIERPESFHADSVVRSTASLHYVSSLAEGRNISASLVWARNYKTVGRYATQSYLAEGILPVTGRDFITGRYEWSQRDELFEYDHDLAHEIYHATGKRAFGVGAATLGYSRTLVRGRLVESTLGFNATMYSISRELRPYYGTRPGAFTAFVRFRLNREEN